ncbi:MAG: hypothetical protein JNJ71_10220 [Rubrivivax sp.]|nr:hypothetical protein [Rubrivivax sp.]
MQWAPGNLNQPILPNWSFNLFNVNMGTSSNAAIEQQALVKVGSYGKQIGRLAEAVELLIDKLQLIENADLTQAEKDTLTVFLADVAAVRKIKKEASSRSLLRPGPDASSAPLRKKLGAGHASL